MQDAARALSTTLRTKLAPLLRLLASDIDGERAGAAAAIGRLLQKHDRDFHDLTEVLLAEPAPVGPEPHPAPGATSWKRTVGPVDLPRQQLLDLLDLVEQRSPFLPLKSAEFVASLRSRSFRPKMHLSEKQWCWLQDLIEGTGV